MLATGRSLLLDAPLSLPSPLICRRVHNATFGCHPSWYGNFGITAASQQGSAAVSMSKVRTRAVVVSSSSETNGEAKRTPRTKTSCLVTTMQSTSSLCSPCARAARQTCLQITSLPEKCSTHQTQAKQRLKSKRRPDPCVIICRQRRQRQATRGNADSIIRIVCIANGFIQTHRAGNSQKKGHGRRDAKCTRQLTRSDRLVGLFGAGTVGVTPMTRPTWLTAH